MLPTWGGCGTSTFLNNLQNAFLPTCSFTISFAMLIMCFQRKTPKRNESRRSVRSFLPGLRTRSVGMDSGSMISTQGMDEKAKETAKVKREEPSGEVNLKLMCEIEKEGISAMGDGYENFGPPEQQEETAKPNSERVVKERKRMSAKPRGRPSRQPMIKHTGKTALKPQPQPQPQPQAQPLEKNKPLAISSKMMTAEEKSHGPTNVPSVPKKKAKWAALEGTQEEPEAAEVK